MSAQAVRRRNVAAPSTRARTVAPTVTATSSANLPLRSPAPAARSRQLGADRVQIRAELLELLGGLGRGLLAPAPAALRGVRLHRQELGHVGDALDHRGGRDAVLLVVG